MRPATATATVLVLAAMTAGCGGGSSTNAACASARSVDVGVASGAPSPRVALQRLIDGGAKWMNTDGWNMVSSESGPNVTVTYRSGTDSVTFSRDDRNQRWYLDAYRNCR